jgi:hypothetical protein
MKKLLVSIMIMSAAFLFMAAEAPAVRQADQQLSPVSPPIVREGDFAVRLVEVLGLGQARDEVEAESKCWDSARQETRSRQRAC